MGLAEGPTAAAQEVTLALSFSEDSKAQNTSTKQDSCGYQPPRLQNQMHWIFYFSRCTYGTFCLCCWCLCYETRSLASAQPLSTILCRLGHSWFIPLCFHGSVWSLSAEAERDPLTGAWTDRVNVEFTRLSPCLAVPLARSLSCLSPLCLF